MTDPELVARARAWLASDPDPATRAELQALLDGGPGTAADLADRFERRLSFGTGGLRGEMGAGPARLNRVVVRQATAGLMGYLGPRPRPRHRVVVGHDARHLSAELAADAARVVAGSGGEALVLAPHAPTPLVAFAVRHLGVDAGVVCTASHNPPTDNGFKVYLADGAPVAPPADTRIAAAIEAAGAAPPGLAPQGDRAIVHLGDEVAEAYLDHAVGLLAPGPREVSVVYTPLHGVGLALTAEAFRRAGFPDLVTVAEQAQPDPAFPTTPHPNPEEAGALAMAEAVARAEGADLVLAHDPDADRLGVLVPRGVGWTALTGNQVGALLADHLLAGGSGADRQVVDTVVSSSLLGRLATAHGVHHERTLPGFKWLMRPVVEHPERRLVLACEEALGYAVDGTVRDKDGITAALVVAALVAQRRADGETVWHQLERLARRFGYHATDSWSVRFTGLGAHRRAAKVVERFRHDPPRRLAERTVTEVVDLAPGVDGLPPSDTLILRLEGGAWVAVRPSGTEPKVKVYAEVVTHVAAGGDAYDLAESEAAAQLVSLRSAVRGALRAEA